MFFRKIRMYFKKIQNVFNENSLLFSKKINKIFFFLIISVSKNEKNSNFLIFKKI